MSNESKPLRILVVDDDALSRDVIALLLEHAGYAVNTADSGDAAVHLLNTTPGAPPNVVLADIQMPGTAGAALARALRKCCGTDSRLLAMSGSIPTDEVTREFDGLLLKPFTAEELTDVMAATSNPQPPVNAIHHDLAPLDEAIYDKLAASMRKERLQQLYALCLGDVADRIVRLRQTASNQEDAAFRKEAHAIRGGAGMVGAVELQAMAASLEESGIHANHVASLDGLTVACGRLRRILNARKIV